MITLNIRTPTPQKRIWKSGELTLPTCGVPVKTEVLLSLCNTIAICIALTSGSHQAEYSIWESQSMSVTLCECPDIVSMSASFIPITVALHAWLPMSKTMAAAKRNAQHDGYHGACVVYGTCTLYVYDISCTYAICSRLGCLTMSMHHAI